MVLVLVLYREETRIIPWEMGREMDSERMATIDVA